MLSVAETEKLLARKLGPCRPMAGMFMFRSLSRITLENADIRVERLQDISEEDAIAEGVEEPGQYLGLTDDGCAVFECRPDDYVPTFRDGFAFLWDGINAKRGFPWASNPWVWRIKFKRVNVESTHGVRDERN